MFVGGTSLYALHTTMCAPGLTELSFLLRIGVGVLNSFNVYYIIYIHASAS